MLLAVGTEDGAVEVWSVERPTLETNVAAELVGAVPAEMAHVSSVNSLDWSDPAAAPGGGWSALLASGGSDNFVRITRVEK